MVVLILPPAVRDDGSLDGEPVEVDLDRLSPRARALAEAIHGTPLHAVVDIWMESDRPIREIVRDWETYYTPEQANRPDRRPWRGWAKARRGAVPREPHAYLEYEAAKIPAGWHVLGADPDRPAVTQVYGMTTQQVLAHLGRRGRVVRPVTWRAYVSRGQAPAPSARVGDTPLWDPDDIIAYASGTWQAAS